MSFDPQNPRGAPRPTPPPSPPPQPSPQPSAPKYVPAQSSYVPTGPVDRRPSLLVIAAIVVIAIGVLGFGALILSGLGNKPLTPPPTASLHASAPASTTPSTRTAQPSTSLQPSAQPTTNASAVPTTTSSGPPTIEPSAGTAEATLLTHIPTAISETCTTTPGTDDILASADCTNPDGTITVSYVQYASVTPMNAAYLEAVGRSQIEANTGSCEDHATWPAESSYDVEGEPTGRRLCTDNPGSPTIVWTDERMAIISQAASPSDDAAGLIEFWTNEAGPILP